MNVVLDKDFLMGFIYGVGIAVAAKLAKDAITWIVTRKNDTSITFEMKKTLLKKLIGVLVMLRLMKAKKKAHEEVYDIDSYQNNKFLAS